MQCPSCGMPVDADQRYAKLVVCAACHSSVVLDEKAARLSGKMAVLAETPSPLYINATGKLGGKRWKVLGRVRYGYARGYWDEWYLQFDDGKAAWFSEDEGNLAIEVQEDIDPAAVDYASVSPGDTLNIGGIDYHVDEKDVAHCEGGAGQLPFVIEQNEQIPFLELSADKHFATVEFDIDDHQARLFRGRRVDLNDLEVDMPRELVGASGVPSAERAGSGDQRERVVRSDDRARSLNCNCCGAPLTIPDGGADAVRCDHCGTSVDTSTRRVTCKSCNATIPIYGHLAAKTVVCPKCRAQCDITGSESSLLAVVAQKDRPKVPFRMGQRGRLRGLDVVIVGHLRYRERDEGVDYDSDEFLLHCRGAGYRWLIMENGHFTLAEELDNRPLGVTAAHIPPGEHFRFDGIRYRVFERGRCKITWVDGELPWVAKVGDSNQYMDATAPPILLSAEWTTTEQEWYRGHYLAREEVIKAFGLRPSDLPKLHGIAPHQQFIRSAFRKQAMVMMGVAALVFGFMAVGSLLKSGHKIGTVSLQAKDYAEEYITEPFTTTMPNALCAARFDSPVNNSWLYLDAAVLNDRDEVLFDFSAQVSYYQGVEGGERWREGSQHDTKLFRLDEPGTYRFLVCGQAGSGETNVYTAGMGPPVTIEVREGMVLARYFIILMVLCATWFMIEVIARASFQSRKWNESDVEDD